MDLAGFGRLSGLIGVRNNLGFNRVRFIQRLDEADLLEIVLVALLTLGGESLLRDKLLSVNIFRIPVLILLPEDHLELRMQVIREIDKVGLRPRSDE